MATIMIITTHPRRRRLSTTAREALYDRCRGEAEFPTCNICGQLILIGDAWDESHDPEGPPYCFGGTETGVAHRACNRRRGAAVVRPVDAKATRVRQRHIGAFQTRHKLPGGKTDWRKRKLNGEIVLRWPREPSPIAPFERVSGPG